MYFLLFLFFTLQAPATLRLCRQQLFIRQFPKRECGARSGHFHFVAALQKGMARGQWHAGQASRFSLCRVESTLTTTFTCVWYIVSLIVVVLVAAAAAAVLLLLLLLLLECARY